MSDFSYKRRYTREGTYRVQYDGKCKVCRRENDRQNRIRNRTQEDHKHIGPALGTAERFWVCRLAPTQVDRERRYVC